MKSCNFNVQNTVDKVLARLTRGQARTEGLQHQDVVLDGLGEVLVRDLAVLVVVHLLERHLDEVLDALVLLGVLLRGLDLGEAGAHHGEHLLPRDVPVLVQVVDVEAVGNLLIQRAWILNIYSPSLST